MVSPTQMVRQVELLDTAGLETDVFQAKTDNFRLRYGGYRTLCETGAYLH